MTQVKIGIIGAGGRMGRLLLGEVLSCENALLAGATARPGSSIVGLDIGALLAREPLGLTIGDDAGALFAVSDVIIDFSAPDVAEHHARLAAVSGTALVLGTTGVSMRQEAWLPETARSAAIVWAPNMSLGVTALLSLVERLAAQLDSAAFDIEIIEMHHRHKVDAPSGTALGLAEAAARGRGVGLESVWRKSRDGRTGPRPVGEIGISAVRGGDVVGDHTVIFAADGERIEITHRATSRQIFARGAVRAALWVFGRPPGLYTMKDVLDLSPDETR